MTTSGAETDALRSGRADLRSGRWTDARASFERALATGESPQGYEGLSWAAWWLDDAETVFAARERAYRLYRRGGDAAGSARMATWLAADRLDFHGAAAVAGGGCGAPVAFSSRSSLGPTTAGSPSTRATSRTSRATASGHGSSPPSPPTSDGASACPTSRCSVSRSRAPRSSPALRWPTACASSARRPRRRSRARRRSRSRAHGHAASSSPPAQRCSTTSARSSGVTGSPSSRSATAAGTCSRSAAPSTAPCTCGGVDGPRRRRCWRHRSQTSSAPARPGSGPRSWGSRSCDGGRAGRPRPSGCSIGPGHGPARSSAALAWRSTAGTRSRPPSRSSGCCARPPSRGRSIAFPRSPSSFEHGWSAASSRTRAGLCRSCEQARGSSAPLPCAPALTSPRACSPPHGASTSGRARCSRTPSTASRQAGRRSRPPRRGSSSPRASWRSAAPSSPSTRRPLPFGRSSISERMRQPPGRDGSCVRSPASAASLHPRSRGESELFGDRVTSLELTRRQYVEHAANPRDYIALFEENFGPVVAIRKALAAKPERLDAFDRSFLAFATSSSRGAPGGPAEYPYAYLLVVARTCEG